MPGEPATMDVTLVPAEAFTIPPSQGGVWVRFWDADFRLIADNAVADTAAARFLTVDSADPTDGRRQTFTLEPLNQPPALARALHAEPI